MKKNKKSNKYINLFFLLSVILFQDITAMEYNSQDLQQNNDEYNNNKSNILIDLIPEMQFYIMFKLVEIQADNKQYDVNKHIVIKRILCNLFSTCKYFKQFDNKKDINYIITNISDLLKAKGNENYKFNINKLKVILDKLSDLDWLEIKKLILSGADINIQSDKYGNTALIRAVIEGHTDIVKLLITAGADVNIQDKYDNTALIWAVIKDHTDIVKLLIAAGTNINAKNNNGNTALILVPAAKNGHQNIVGLLIAAGADVNIQNKYGDTVLMWAVRKGHKEIVKLLISAGTDINIQNKDGDTALSIARKMGYTKIISLLLEQSNDYTCILF